MFDLRLDWSRCLDGAEIVDYGPERPRQRGETIYDVPKYGRHFRLKSDRRELIRLDCINLELPVVLHFINATTENALVQFFGRYGLLDRMMDELPAEYVVGQQAALFALLVSAVSGEPKLRGLAVERLLQNTLLKPFLDFSKDGLSARSLQPRTLQGFMIMEILFAAAKGARLACCEYCTTAFFTGSMTGRRSSSKYCRDRCRVAGNRKRQKEGEINVSAKTQLGNRGRG